MRLLKNRIVISLFAILAVTYFWEFYVKPITGPIYTQAVSEYKRKNYARSLRLLEEAYRIDPNDTAILTLFGWDFLKTGNTRKALPYFARAARLNPRLEDARLGLAYCWLELDEPQRALDYFDQLKVADHGSQEVLSAMARANRMLGRNRVALELAAAVLQKDSKNQLATKELAYLTGSETLETLAAMRSGPAQRPANLVVPARLDGGYFQVLRDGAWKRLYVAGVDIGPATPGRFASEPPAELDVYLDWLNQIGALGANCVRLYTLLPPAFYRALLTYNIRNRKTPIYLFQEIWVGDPPDDNLFRDTFTAEYEQQLRDVIDVIHGQADLPILKGRPGGIFLADVSPYVLGWLIGREIEPHVALTTNLRNPGITAFEGQYLKIKQGNPTEVWLTERCETAIAYEVTKYNWQRPVAFVNWPPLDPLTHPTETRMVDELRLRRMRGEKLAPLGLGVPDDADAVSLDEEKITAQPAFQAGYFALYHIYPFWPDFIFLDPAYRSARDRQGLNAYWGYLQDLKKHYQRTPLVVGEYGISTSIGTAHFNPNGWNHGGLNEVQQGQALVRLTGNIRDAGCAGGMIFEWIDEWWKHNWIAENFEKPFSRKALWHNDMDPEQFFGLVRFVPEVRPTYFPVASVSGGSHSSATGPPTIRSIGASWDPSALYLDIDLDVPPGSELNWSEDRYLVALNTCDRQCGSSALPFVKNTHVLFGANFVVHLSGRDASRIVIAEDYNPYRETTIEGFPLLTDLLIPGRFRTAFDPGARFTELIVETNRRRYGRDGTFFPSQRYSRSLLRYGVFDYTAKDYDSLGQWYFEKSSSRIRLRLSWGLLLVLDPSQGLVFDGTDANSNPTGRIARQIQFTAVSYAAERGGSGSGPAQIVARSASSDTIAEGWSIPWPTWSSVETKAVPKQSYQAVAKAFSQLTGYPAAQ